jgi:hypothetical protein
MQPKTQTVQGYERFQPSGTEISIQFSDHAREHMLNEVMTGFGAVPRRGAEVGGVLLGRKDGDTIWIEDVAQVGCEHRRGPSFLLSEQDRANLDQVVRELRTLSDDKRPVGLFRSNTRDLDTITEEDREVFAAFFPPPDGLFVMVRPFATKPSRIAFLGYQDGRLPDESEMFSLAKPQSAAGAPSRYRSAPPPPPRDSAPERFPPPPDTDPWIQPATSAAAAPAARVEFDNTPIYGAEYDHSEPVESPRRRTWMLAPLSFIFLLLGVLLGFQSALTLYPKPKAVDASALSAGLTAARKGDNLHIRWNRESLAITSAQSGVLEIEDGPNRKMVELDSSALQNGSVIYPPVSERVTLRLDIVVNSGTRVVETLSWSKSPE